MKVLFKISIVLFIVATLSSCINNGVRGKGNVITETRKISNNFSAIKASKGLDVYITRSDDFSVIVEADENLHDLIQVDVIEDVLVITAEKNIGFAKAKKVHVSVKSLNEILVSSGAEIYSENTFFSNNLTIHATSGSEVNMRLNVTDLTCDASSGSDVNLAGKAVNFKAFSSSGSDINTYKLEVKNCEARASSGSDIEVNVSTSLDAKVTSGASIKYKGNPAVIDKSESSGGSIRNKNS